MFRIGEFARLAGVSAKLLRAWDELGLFRPVWVDRSNGYRYYSPAQLPALRRILALRDVGVPLAAIADLVAGGADLQDALTRRRAELERERREIERRLRALDISLALAEPGHDRVGGGDHEVRTWDIVVRPMAAEPVATLTVDPEVTDLGAAFYELEAYVRDQRRRGPRPPGAIDAADPGDHRVELVVPVTGPVAPRGAIGYRRLPACRAASLIHRGSYAGLVAARAALARWVRAAGLEPAGPLRVLYLQFGAEPELRVPNAYLVDREADLVTELQQPVG
ncbi:MAG: MerR family transcriptional regulator [Chloroflexota bacterium]